jgi:Fe-S oxidoreductase
MIFLEEKCERCGTCLIKCPYIEVSKEDAEKEIKNLIETRSKSELLEKCIGCALCDSLCPTKSNPSLLIREISDKNAKKEGIP